MLVAVPGSKGTKTWNPRSWRKCLLLCPEHGHTQVLYSFLDVLMVWAHLGFLVCLFSRFSLSILYTKLFFSLFLLLLNILLNAWGRFTQVFLQEFSGLYSFFCFALCLQWKQAHLIIHAVHLIFHAFSSSFKLILTLHFGDPISFCTWLDKTVRVQISWRV